MTLSNEDRVLRLTLMATFLVAMSFLLPYGIHTNNVVPPIGLVPAGLSALTSLYHFSGLAIHQRFNILLDSFLSLFLLAMYIASTVTIADYWRLDMLGTYGTIPLLMAFFIHTYLVMRDTHILELVRFHMSALVEPPHCPHCQRAVLSTWGMTSTQAPSSASSRHSYVAVDTPGEDECPENHGPGDYKDASPTRGSVDETTRLV